MLDGDDDADPQLRGRAARHANIEFGANILGLILATREAVKSFGDDGGSVINIGSVVSSMTPPSSVVYTATKGAVDAMSGVLSKELAPRKIRVNSINPGMVETEGIHAQGFPKAISRSRRSRRLPWAASGNRATSLQRPCS